MERYAVSWSDVYAHANDDFDGLNTARFATLREAVPCAMKHSGIIRNMKESPADGGTMRFYNEPGEWSATGRPWGYARDCFIAAAGDALFSATMASLEAASKSMATLTQDSGEDYEVLRVGFYMVLMQTIIDKMRELGVEEDAIVMGIKEVLHGDEFETAEPDENQVWH